MSDLIADIFARMPTTDLILVWECATKRSHWFPAPDVIDPAIYPRDTYFGAATRPVAAKLGATKRGGNALVTGIGALWLDIDLRSPAHQKAALPETQDEALGLLARAFPDLPPSAIIHSGHGLQVWFYLDQWVPITEANRISISTTLSDFNARWRAECAQAGYDADSVCDLSRVMRLPGTSNHKLSDRIVPVVTIKADDSIRYVPRDIRAMLGPARQATAAPVKKPLPAVDPEPVAQSHYTMPEEIQAKFDCLLQIDPAIQGSWDRDNPRLRDQSPSAYDMSLAQYCVRAGLDLTETESVLRAFRSRHSIPQKPDSYYRSTVTKAQAEASAQDETLPNQAATTAGHQQEQRPDEAPRFNTPQEAWTSISSELTIDIAGLTRLDAEEPAYELHLADGRSIHFSCIDHLVSQTKARNILAAATGTLPPKKSLARWDNIIRVALSYLTHDTAGYETTISGQMSDWVAAYLRNTSPATTPAEAIQAAAPWTDDAGNTLITAASLRYWIAIHLQERVTPRTICLALRTIGATATKLPPGSGATSAWILPKEHAR